MPLHVPSGFAQVVHKFGADLTGRRYLNTYGISLGWEEPNDIKATAEELHHAYWEEFLDDTLNGDYFLESTKVIAKFDGDDFEYEHIEFETSELSGERVPINCALLIHKGSIFAGRRNRGRLYVPGVVAEGDANDNGALSSDAVSDFQSRADDWLTRVNTGDAVIGEMVILHTTNNDPTPVSGLFVDPVLGTQRRRMRS